MTAPKRLLLGLVALASALWFVGVGAALHPESALFRADVRVSNALHVGTAPWLVRALSWVTVLGNGESLTALAIVGASFLLWRGRRGDAALFAIALIGGGALNTGLKVVYARARPTFVDPITIAEGFSFPSGHAMGTLLLAGLLAHLVSVRAKTATTRALVYALAAVWTLTMGFSRVVLGVHYPSDVLGGYAAGIFWLAVCLAIASAREPEDTTDGAGVKGQISRSR